MIDPPTRLETVRLATGDAQLFVAPARGGMATRFFVGDRAVFYLDETTLLDPAKNVRGGNPVLFPSPGKLSDDRFTRPGEGHAGKLGQHGFARSSAWEVTEQQGTDVTLKLAANDATRAVYPWDFTLTYRYQLRQTDREAAVLRIDQRFETTSATPVPFGAGFHPYFAVPQATKAKIDLTAAEVDLHLVDHDANVATLDLGDGSRIEVRASPEFRAWVVWTLEGKDFVCVEPWTGPANALNTGEGLLHVSESVPVALWTEIAFLRNSPRSG
jgi:galactose mutarotase-like enzyme